MIVDKESPKSVALLWRGDAAARNTSPPHNSRLAPIFDAFTRLGVTAEFAVYAEEHHDEIREQLLRVDGVLVWVDPISGERDRSQLDPLLREVAVAGTWVSAHPDVIDAMGTKEVLFRTRELGWVTDTHVYRSTAAMAAELPGRLAGGPRVLKPNRGNGGIGVWKVAALPSEAPESRVRIQHASHRGTVTEDLPLASVIDRFRDYLLEPSCVVDQAFQPRIKEGLIRCYCVQNEVVGFARQVPDDPTADVLGLPSGKTMFDATEPEFQPLRTKLEGEWVPAMQALLGIPTASLPALWDADFLFGPRDAAGANTYVLCEINVSSVAPFPPQAVPKIAAATLSHLRSPRSAPAS